MFPQGRIRMGHELGDDPSVECCGNARLTTRTGPRGTGASRPLPRPPTSNRGARYVKQQADLIVGHAGVERCQHVSNQIEMLPGRSDDRRFPHRRM